ncbi:arginase [Photobacterium ganghwense]|uniref:Arginase n=1 Tax=Photobacterium ganghwense TaxID=320778 RepID=A0A0J1HEH6_9GAMM|nr:arginase family protein [Photobacterium ganghwense]KLV10018.1 arginase [Photobacterium ganghwense]PSU09124.1 arginase [Photobacterium ganghwense]QSV16321.1 arginase family protein [Photobacterium ganghwense]
MTTAKPERKPFDIIGAPFNQLGFVPTDNNTVQPLREPDERCWLGLTEWIAVRNQRWGGDIRDMGDVLPDARVRQHLHDGKKEQALAAYCQLLHPQVLATYQQGRVPIILGGDHSITVGTLQATLDYFQPRNESVAVVWIDAHADCNDSPASNLHGKPLAMLMGEYCYNGWQVASDSLLKPESVYYVGVRDLMPNEAALLERHGITNYNMEYIDRHGFRQMLSTLVEQLEIHYDRFFVSFDYDSLDGAIYRACATPNVGGLTAREALTLVHTLAAHPKFVGMDLVEYLPEKDDNGVSKELMIKLIDAVWGFRM